MVLQFWLVQQKILLCHITSFTVMARLLQRAKPQKHSSQHCSCRQSLGTLTGKPSHKFQLMSSSQWTPAHWNQETFPCVFVYLLFFLRGSHWAPPQLWGQGPPAPLPLWRTGWPMNYPKKQKEEELDLRVKNKTTTTKKNAKQNQQTFASVIHISRQCLVEVGLRVKHCPG